MQTTLAVPETQAAWKQLKTEVRSRSLAFDRFADPRWKDKGEETPRKNFFREALKIPYQRCRQEAWFSFLNDRMALKDDGLLYAQLQSRLMVNMAGGVMENAGLCLDRFGLPYIPGSAVKGCARRMAVEELRQATQEKKSLTELAPLLAAIARVFGWGDTDWKDGRNSDFEFACRDAWKQVRPLAANLLLDALLPSKREHQDQPWRDLPSFAGSVSFLPAYPVDLGKTGKIDGLSLDVPPLGKLELDVVTCHHRKYYEGADPAYATAPDTEEPVPVVFPAVAAGHVFAFACTKLRNCSHEDLRQARAWLACGLQSFGLGAKTNAGYGWFLEVSKTVAPFFKLSRQVGEVESMAQRFSALSEDERLELIFKLADMPHVCRAWCEQHPATAKPVIDFAGAQGFQLP